MGSTCSSPQIVCKALLQSVEKKNHFTILCLQSNYVWTIHVQPSHDLASGHLWIELGYTLARALECSPSCFKSSHPWVALTKDLVRMCDAYMTTSLQRRRANGEIYALFQRIPSGFRQHLLPTELPLVPRVLPHNIYHTGC